MTWKWHGPQLVSGRLAAFAVWWPEAGRLINSLPCSYERQMCEARGTKKCLSQWADVLDGDVRDGCDNLSSRNGIPRP
jgi:hypothetical protein